MKLVCTKSDHDDINVWRFTEGKEYKLHGSLGGDDYDDAHVFDDNGLELWLFKYDGVIKGAGVNDFTFAEAGK